MLIDGIEEKSGPTADKLLKGSEELIKKADKFIKDKTP